MSKASLPVAARRSERISCSSMALRMVTSRVLNKQGSASPVGAGGGGHLKVEKPIGADALALEHLSAAAGSPRWRIHSR